MLNTKLLWILTIFFTASVGMRFNISILAWVMFVPLLLLARTTSTKKEWFSLFILLQIAYFLQILKIITDPIPVVMALIFSIPAALSVWGALWIFEKTRQRVGDLWGIFFFASLMSVIEWLNYHTQLGSWGSMFYTQLDKQVFLQLSSLFGITFGSFFIYLSSAFLTVFIVSNDKKQFMQAAFMSFAIFLMLYIYGVYRVTEGTNPSKNILVASITSDLQITQNGIQPREVLQKNTQILIDKTYVAIKRDAKIIAWNEAATIVHKEDEKNLKEKLKTISLENNVTLVIAYIVPIDGVKKFENKYLLISKGNILDEYYKFHPVPGEGSIKGDKIAKAINLGNVTISGAICYDFDFPNLGRQLAQKHIDIAIVPSSDWKGIDHIHAKQAMVRAIEGGYSLLRPVRGSTSYAFDAYGNIRASLSYFEDNDHIMIASLPTKRVWTLYSIVGDIFPLSLLLLLGYIGILSWRYKCH